uniref:Uncharacterized protein n=1 Tax=Neospora caninum (strain Liverpool) TaxID=572307 RepID=A0A0F7UIG2_NEOCL|nr:TPA: hypothetical protein BN1204_055380 [Neospora caninum Liverpool]
MCGIHHYGCVMFPIVFQRLIPLLDEGPGHKSERRETATRRVPPQARHSADRQAYRSPATSPIRKTAEEKKKPHKAAGQVHKTPGGTSTPEASEDDKKRGTRTRRGVAPLLEIVSPSMSLSGSSPPPSPLSVDAPAIGPDAAPLPFTGGPRRTRTVSSLFAFSENPGEMEDPGQKLDGGEPYSSGTGHTQSGDSIHTDAPVGATKAGSRRAGCRRHLPLRFPFPLLSLPPATPPAPPPTPISPLTPRTPHTPSKQLATTTHMPFVWQDREEEFEQDELEVIHLPPGWWGTLGPNRFGVENEEVTPPSRPAGDTALGRADAAVALKWPSTGMRDSGSEARNEQTASEEELFPRKRSAASLVAVPAHRPHLPNADGEDRSLTSFFREVSKALGVGIPGRDRPQLGTEAADDAADQVSKSKKALADRIKALAMAHAKESTEEGKGEAYEREQRQLEDYGGLTDELPAGRLSLIFLGVVCAVSRVGFDIRKRKKRERQRRLGRMAWRSRFQSSPDFSVSRAGSQLDYTFSSFSRTSASSAFTHSTLSTSPNAFGRPPRPGGESESTASTGSSHVSSSASSSSADSIPVPGAHAKDGGRKNGAHHGSMRRGWASRPRREARLADGEARPRAETRNPVSGQKQTGEPKRQKPARGLAAGGKVPASARDSFPARGGNEEAPVGPTDPSLQAAPQSPQTRGAATSPGLPSKQTKRHSQQRAGFSTAYGTRRRSIRSRKRRRHRQNEEAATAPAAGLSVVPPAQNEAGRDSRTAFSVYENPAFSPYQEAPEHSDKLDWIVNALVRGKGA